jgi:hypothetical protein
MKREDLLMPLTPETVPQHMGKGCRHNKTRYAIIRESIHNGMYVRISFGNGRKDIMVASKELEVYKANAADYQPEQR